RSPPRRGAPAGTSALTPVPSASRPTARGSRSHPPSPPTPRPAVTSPPRAPASCTPPSRSSTNRGDEHGRRHRVDTPAARRSRTPGQRRPAHPPYGPPPPPPPHPSPG